MTISLTKTDTTGCVLNLTHSDPLEYLLCTKSLMICIMYHRFMFDYKDADKCERSCLKDSIQIKDGSLAMTWWNQLPVIWKTWGSSVIGQNWSHEMVVSRDTLCHLTPRERDNCEITIQFQEFYLPFKPFEEETLDETGTLALQYPKHILGSF